MDKDAVAHQQEHVLESWNRYSFDVFPIFTEKGAVFTPEWLEK
jgi:hypothetical protein